LPGGSTCVGGGSCCLSPSSYSDIKLCINVLIVGSVKPFTDDAEDPSAGASAVCFISVCLSVCLSVCPSVCQKFFAVWYFHPSGFLSLRSVKYRWSMKILDRDLAAFRKRYKIEDTRGHCEILTANNDLLTLSLPSAVIPAAESLSI